MGRLLVSSAHPKLPGTYLESGSCEGRPAYVKDGALDSQLGAGLLFAFWLLFYTIIILYIYIYIYLFNIPTYPHSFAKFGRIF